MRIISQGGHADLPYERTQLCSNTENVMARCDGKEYLMGSYVTHEKAIKTMEMCRKNIWNMILLVQICSRLNIQKYFSSQKMRR